MALSPQATTEKSAKTRGAPEPERQAAYDPGLTTRSLVIAVLLTVLSGLWVRQSEIAALTTQITESVPAIPGLAALVLLLLVNVILRRIRGGRPFTRAEILVVFLFVTISTTVMGIGVLQFVFALMCAPFYYTANDIPTLRPFLPQWLLPHNPSLIRHLYEGAPNGQVPWAFWWAPGLIWLGFFLALWCTMYCMMALFYRVWAEEERLAFPLVFLPMEMTEGESGTGNFFRNKLMWGGFAVAAVYNLVNIVHALYPSLPPFGKEYDFTPALTNPPWNALVPLGFYFRPEMIGLGYLVSTNISLTVWLSFFLLKLGAVFAASQGYEPRELYPQEQGIGAFLVLAVMLVWLARRHLWAAWRAALSGRQTVGPEGISYRWMFLGFFGGFAAVWAFATAAGMAAWVAFLYLAVVLAVALVYGRMRGQAGVPLVWLFPFFMQKQAFLYTFGSQPFAASGQTTLPAWALFSFLARGYYPTMTGYQIEGMEITRRAHINPKRVAFAVFLALVVGFVVGWYNHLVPYYHQGALHGRDGIWGTGEALSEYQSAAQYAVTPKQPELQRIWATGIGAFMVIVLTFLHLRFTSFPLHPLGYAMTCSYGSLIWGSFFIVWLLKSLMLRYGGMKLYRQTIPFFLGFALGHFAVAGILWGLTGVWTGEAVKGYAVWFG
ncbi:MAG TPA: DUF6785 family protein [Chthonomonadaceae bacterium]|nr:DUF6785 family protein [Chthonomonadaceae bacterium]